MLHSRRQKGMHVHKPIIKAIVERAFNFLVDLLWLC